MNDGEYCASFHQLKDAKKYRSNNNWRYISRYIRIFDNKKDIYIIYSNMGGLRVDLYSIPHDSVMETKLY